MNLFIIWISAFSIVFLLGLQAQFVRDKIIWLSFATSMMISICEVMILTTVPKATTIEIIAFITGGPCGIVASIIIHNKFFTKTRSTNV